MPSQQSGQPIIQTPKTLLYTSNNPGALALRHHSRPLPDPSSDTVLVALADFTPPEAQPTGSHTGQHHPLCSLLPTPGKYLGAPQVPAAGVRR